MNGDAAVEAGIEARWQSVRDDGRVRAELVEAACGEPRLRRLFAWVGMGELHFSRNIGRAKVGTQAEARCRSGGIVFV
jgi:hypothetical protein